MTVLDACRDVLEAAAPGLSAGLEGCEFRPPQFGPSPGIISARSTAGFIIGPELGGEGLAAQQLVRVSVATGAAAPSLAVAMTMHHFTVATLQALQAEGHQTVWALMEAIASKKLLMASGFAEGSAGQSVVQPRVRATPTEGGYVVSGSKKPCSLAHSMDLLSLSVDLDDDKSHYGVAIVPAAQRGIQVRPFWAAPVLHHAESDQVVLDNLFVEDSLIVRVPREGSPGEPTIQDIGFVWFEILMTSCYLGMLLRIIEISSHARTSREIHRAQIAAEQIARRLLQVAESVDQHIDHETLRAALMLRQELEDLLTRAVPISLDNAGGIAAIASPELLYLTSAVQCLRFHPPSMSRMSAESYQLLASGGYCHVE